MMMPEIQLDIDQLMSDVIELNIAKLADIDTTMQSACNTVATLTVAGWEGEAKDEFLIKFTEFKQEMRIFYENMSTFNEYLKRIYAEGESVYKEGASLLNAL